LLLRSGAAQYTMENAQWRTRAELTLLLPPLTPATPRPHLAMAQKEVPIHAGGVLPHMLVARVQPLAPLRLQHDWLLWLRLQKGLSLVQRIKLRLRLRSVYDTNRTPGNAVRGKLRQSPASARQAQATTGQAPANAGQEPVSAGQTWASRQPKVAAFARRWAGLVLTRRNDYVLKFD
jgi:hypothetical protein